jgi:hypothetical protein
VIEKPTLEVEVARPTIFRPLTVVVPKPPLAIERALGVEVAQVVAEVVPMERESPVTLKAKMLEPASERAS